MTTSVRAALAVGLLAGFYVLAGGVLAALVVLNVVTALNQPGLALKLLIISAVAAVAVLRGVFAVNRGGAGPGAGTGEQSGVAVTPEREPGLWAVVTELAAQVGTRAPDELRLVPDVNAAVTEDIRWLGLRPGTRRMFIGLPLLVTLSTVELRAILGHELGHYSGQHTRLGGITYRGRLAVERTVAHLEDRPAIRRLFALYGRLYLRASMAVARRQELEADAMMVAIAGREPAARALREVWVTAAAWDCFLDNYLAFGWRAGYVPDDVFGGFQALVSDRTRQRELDAIRRSVPEGERNPYDSHPSLAQRLEAIAGLPDPGVGQDPRPALTLLAERDRVCAEVVETMLGPDSEDRTVLPWYELAHRAATANAAEAAASVLRAAERVLATAPARLGHLLALLEAGRADELGRHLVEAGPDADPERVRRTGREVLGYALAQLVATALTDAGRASWALSWSSPCRLLDAAGAEPAVRGWVSAAVADPARVPELREHLAQLGVPAEYGARPLARAARAF